MTDRDTHARNHDACLMEKRARSAKPTMADSSSWETVDDSWETALALVRRLTTTTTTTAHPPPDAALLDELESLIGQVRQQHHHNPAAAAAAAPPPSVTPPPIIDSSLSDLQIRRDVKAATVRIGLYDRRDKVFFNLGSGSIVSAQGHILTADRSLQTPGLIKT